MNNSNSSGETLISPRISPRAVPEGPARIKTSQHRKKRADKSLILHDQRLSLVLRESKLEQQRIQSSPSFPAHLLSSLEVERAHSHFLLNPSSSSSPCLVRARSAQVLNSWEFEKIARNRETLLTELAHDHSPRKSKSPRDKISPRFSEDQRTKLELKMLSGLKKETQDSSQDLNSGSILIELAFGKLLTEKKRSREPSSAKMSTQKKKSKDEAKLKEELAEGVLSLETEEASVIKAGHLLAVIYQLLIWLGQNPNSFQYKIAVQQTSSFITYSPIILSVDSMLENLQKIYDYSFKSNPSGLDGFVIFVSKWLESRFAEFLKKKEAETEDKTEASDVTKLTSSTSLTSCNTLCSTKSTSNLSSSLPNPPDETPPEKKKRNKTRSFLRSQKEKLEERETDDVHKSLLLLLQKNNYPLTPLMNKLLAFFNSLEPTFKQLFYTKLQGLVNSHKDAKVFPDDEFLEYLHRVQLDQQILLDKYKQEQQQLLKTKMVTTVPTQGRATSVTRKTSSSTSSANILSGSATMNLRGRSDFRRRTSTLILRKKDSDPLAPSSSEPNLPDSLSVDSLLVESLLYMRQQEFMDFDPKELSEQFNFYETRLFLNVHADDLLFQCWEERKGRTNSAVFLLNKRFNKVAYWVISEVVSNLTLKKRVEVVKRLITIAQRCWKAKNFSVALAIFVALNSSSIHRLKQTWREVPTKFLKIFQKRILTFENNYKIYRQRLTKAINKGQPCIPLIDVIVSDLVHANEISDTIEHSFEITENLQFHNFKKIERISSLIQQIEKIQEFPFDNVTLSHTRLMPLQYVILLPNVIFDNESLYRKSMLCEPRT